MESSPEEQPQRQPDPGSQEQADAAVCGEAYDVPPGAMVLGSPGAWDVVKAVLLLLLLQCVVGAILGLFLSLGGSGRDPQSVLSSASFLLPVLALNTLLMVAVAHYFACTKYQRGFMEGFALTGVSFRVVAVSAATGCGLAVFGIVLQTLFPAANSFLVQVLKSRAMIIGWMFFGLLVPPFEELFFRGFMFPAVRKSAGPLTAIAVSAGLFVVAHLQQLAGDWLLLLPIGLMGLTVTIQRHLYDSTTPSAVTHWCYNLVALMVTILSLVFPGILPFGETPHVPHHAPVVHVSEPTAEEVKADLIGSSVGDEDVKWIFANTDEFTDFDVTRRFLDKDSVDLVIDVFLQGATGPACQTRLDVHYRKVSNGWRFSFVRNGEPLKMVPRR